MRNLELNCDEARLLADVLNTCIDELRTEIADTDSISFKQMLKKRRAVLCELLARLEGKAAPAVHPAVHLA